ncbi:MAG: type I-C CRISPR-associated protein Cas8c/Csd1, partial [Spirochaetaceae bacterium]|nr:type I-C CRISPR-associated protein Cas8c/Csd1 [Spirochaetaceae bacterium]
MILQALKSYYDRKAADEESGIAPEGWEWKEIPFLIVLDANGNFLRFEDTREGEGKKLRGRKFLVPQGVIRTRGVTSNLLWGTSNYVLGVGDKRGKELSDAFKKRIQEELADSKKKNAVMRFLENIDTEKLERDDCWENILNTKPNIT